MALDKLIDSWSSFSRDAASAFLKTQGSPSANSKRILVDVLKSFSASKPISILDLGCGNAHLFPYFKEQGLDCEYFGIDFSQPLLEAAQESNRNDPHAHFIQDDVNELGKIEGQYDVAIYSHVIEMMSSPEQSLLRARQLARRIVIRFFEPPDFDCDSVELREMDVGGDGTQAPYIRRKMSRDYYRMVLSKMGCTQVDIYRDHTAKDQVHVLHY